MPLFCHPGLSICFSRSREEKRGVMMISPRCYPSLFSQWKGGHGAMRKHAWTSLHVVLVASRNELPPEVRTCMRSAVIRYRHRFLASGYGMSLPCVVYFTNPKQENAMRGTYTLIGEDLDLTISYCVQPARKPVEANLRKRTSTSNACIVLITNYLELA